MSRSSYDLSREQEHTRKSNKTALLAGAIGGGAIGVLIIVFLAVICFRKVKRSVRDRSLEQLYPTLAQPHLHSFEPEVVMTSGTRSLTRNYAYISEGQHAYEPVWQSSPPSELGMDMRMEGVGAGVGVEMEPPPYVQEATPLVEGSHSHSVSASHATSSYSQDIQSQSGLSYYVSASAAGSNPGTSAGERRGDLLASFASTRRDIITPELEETLRTIGYQPDIHPDRISAENWRRAGVEPVVVKILREAYQRYVYLFCFW
jgi:hypothetical protein